MNPPRALYAGAALGRRQDFGMRLSTFLPETAPKTAHKAAPQRPTAAAIGRSLVLATALLASFAPGSAIAGTPATTAADVCPGNPATCSVTTTFDVTDHATLDFGTNAVSVTGGGQF